MQFFKGREKEDMVNYQSYLKVLLWGVLCLLLLALFKWFYNYPFS